MECREFIKTLMEAEESNNSFFQSPDYLEHIDNCTSCHKLNLHIIKSMEMLDASTFPQPNPFFTTRMMQLIENKKKSKNYQYLRPFYQLRIATLALLLVLGIGTGIFIGKEWEISQTPTGISQLTDIEEFSQMYYLSDKDNEIDQLSNYFELNQ